jgi:hypothetical protein
LVLKTEKEKFDSQYPFDYYGEDCAVKNKKERMVHAVDW